jgi:hypothetical protein
MHARPPSFALSVAIPLALGAAFWVPAIGAAHGWFPAPLDDVYIHYDFARSLAEGHPFEWIPGQGYSSGETSPLYAAILAVGWLAGFRGRAIAIWAAIVAVLSVALLVRSVVRLAAPCPRWLAWLLALLPLSVGLVDWSLFSGMEVATLAGALGGALVALDRTRDATRGGPTRESRQWRLGLWGAALVLLRPECGVIVFVFAFVAARGAGARSGILALARAALPGAIATAAVLGLNALATGDPRSAGAQLKLLSSNPYLSDVDRARVFVENLVVFAVRGVRSELAVWRIGVWLVPLLALYAAVAGTRSGRRLGAACVVSAIAWTLLVSWNGNAPFHNFRYYAPALVLVLVAASLGLKAMAARSRGLAGAVAFVAIGLAAARIPAQVDYFRRCAANVRDQQVEAGTRIARATPADARILLGDAGAIPFVSDRAAIDALGLGGFHRMPFARAAVYGEAATLELIERLDPSQRPTHLALYPNWFSAITSRFGVELDRVTITDNVICGGPTKGIYRADWSTLATPGERAPVRGSVVDELDVADVVSEAEHRYASPAPAGGWATFEILADDRGDKRFDGGRIIPEHAHESFVARVEGPLHIVVRTDAASGSVLARANGAATELRWLPGRAGGWREGEADIVVGADRTIELYARVGAYRDYHVWLTSPATATLRGE